MPVQIKIRLLDTREAGFEASWAPIEDRRLIDQTRVQESVAAIIDDVRQRGDAGVIAAVERFDGYSLTPTQLEVSQQERQSGASQVAADDRAALELAAERIERFHRYRLPESWVERSNGESLGQLVRPLGSAALYVPAGTAPLASSVLMLALPARVAGVERRVMASPGQTLHPAVLLAAQLAGVTRIYRVGGAQAVAALAYGTESIVRSEKILGPGNAYVQEAKRQVFGQVGIDAEAGPSEVLIIAEPGSSARLLAADLLAQAEHGAASVVLATPDAQLARDTLEEIAVQIDFLSTKELALTSLRDRSAVVVTRDLDEAFDLANRYAAEHLQLFVSDAERWLPRVQNAGAVFVGPYSPVPLGDYVAGPSHVLPTGGTARFFSVLGVDDFVKRMSLIEFDKPALRRVAPAAARLADLEGLDAHARALRARLEDGLD